MTTRENIDNLPELKCRKTCFELKVQELPLMLL
jgi:hypothetical protein